MAGRGRSGVWAIVAPVRVASLRIARRPARYALVAAGIGLATAFLVATLAASLAVSDRTVRRSLAALPAEQRTFRVDAFALSAPLRPRTAPLRALALLTQRRPVHALEYRRLSFGGHRVFLTAVERLPAWIELRSGHLPRRCVPRRCELLAIGRAPLPRVLAVRGLRIAIVGHARLRTPAVLGGFAHPSAATLLVGSDVRGLARVPLLDAVLHTDSWVGLVAPTDVRAWQIESLLARETRAQTLLGQASSSYALSAPDDALLAARSEGSIAARRLLLVGGDVAALLLAFAILAAVGLRRTVGEEWRRLEERGARRAQLWVFATVECGAAAGCGVLTGVLVGTGVGALVGDRAGVGARAVLEHALWTPAGALIALGALVVATTVVLATASARAAARSGPLRLGDVIAAAAVAIAAVAAARGGVGPTGLAASGGNATLLLLFPGLVCLAGALVAARLLGPALRIAERHSRRVGPATRLGLLALARGPSRATACVAFLVLSLGLAFLAGSYRATLDRGVRDEAAYSVPLDFRLTEGARLVGPLEAAPPARYAALAPGTRIYPVVRRFPDVAGLGAARTSPVVLGLPPSAIARVHGWRGDFGRVPPARLARLLGAGDPVGLASLPLPHGTTGLAIGLSSIGVGLELDIALVLPSGAVTTIPLVAPGAPAAFERQKIPPGARVFALELRQKAQEAQSLVHREAEDTASLVPHGRLELSPLVAVGGSRLLGKVTDWRGWIGRNGVTVVSRSPLRLRYAFPTGQTALLRLPQRTDGTALPVAVSPDVARAATSAGKLSLTFGDEPVTGRVVAVARRFPGTEDGDGSFVVADESRLRTALDADDPGAGHLDEAWVEVSPAHAAQVAAALQRPPFAALDVVSRRGVAHGLRTDPLARGIELTLAAAALLALLLAVGGLWLAVLGDVADEHGELYDLEAQGFEPRDLRGQLRLRAGLVALAGLVGGLVLGLVLVSQVVRLVGISAAGSVPVPPLVLALGWHDTVLGLAAVVATGALLVELTVRRAFSGDTPNRSGEAT